MLELRRIGKRFGGVQALADIDYRIGEGNVHSVIGPNGAGKTTLFNVITGVYQPSSGSVVFDGQDVTQRTTNQLAALGFARTFQNLQVPAHMSALENVMVGAHLRLSQRVWPSLLRLPGVVRADRTLREEAMLLMDFVGVEQYAAQYASEMPYGALKRLEIARALAAQPRVLFLDEPAAGLNPTERSQMSKLIQLISARGITIVLVEHDMRLVMDVSNHIMVLDYGRKLAEGKAEEIRVHPEVIAAYLGTSESRSEAMASP